VIFIGDCDKQNKECSIGNGVMWNDTELNRLLEICQERHIAVLTNHSADVELVHEMLL
jgi:hypothetical protein